MTRSLPDGANSTPPDFAVSTRSASASWPGGVDLRLGRWFGDRQEHAVEFIYWGVYNMGSSAQQQTGAPGVLTRSDTINNIEINWLYAPQDRPEFHQDNQRIHWMWLAGFRFFQLEDQLIFDVPSNYELQTETNNNLLAGSLGVGLTGRLHLECGLLSSPNFCLPEMRAAIGQFRAEGIGRCPFSS